MGEDLGAGTVILMRLWVGVSESGRGGLSVGGSWSRCRDVVLV